MTGNAWDPPPELADLLGADVAAIVAAAVAGYRGGLRAKVEALPSMFADDESGGLVILSDVLALIDGSSDGDA